MNNHRFCSLILMATTLSMALPQASFCLTADSGQSVTLHASLQETEYGKSTYFAPASEQPPSLKPIKTKYGPVKKVTTSAASLINFVFDLRGFDWSKEGANAILEEKLKPKSEAAREFLRHKEEDDKQLAIVAATLQLASVEGKDDQKTKEAVVALSRLIGAEESAKIEDKLKLVGTAGSVEISDTDRASADVLQKCDRLRAILEAASEADPVVEVMTKRLHKYNNRNKFLQVTAKAMYATLGVAAFTPTLAAPIAETTLLTFMMVTGGPEQDKLLKEVYLSKCLQSRANLINEKAHLAVDCYDMAVLTKNERLLVCSKDLIRQMTNEKAMAAFLGTEASATVGPNQSQSEL